MAAIPWITEGYKVTNWFRVTEIGGIVPLDNAQSLSLTFEKVCRSHK